MSTQQLVQGIHHVTATVAEARADFDFYTTLLGLRLVKKTVNFDNNQVYHFYYADERGTPGTVFTTFPYAGQPNVRQGWEGTGQISTTTFSTAPAALPFWHERLQAAGVKLSPGERFGQPYLWFRDPAGLQLEILGDAADQRAPWTHPAIAPELALRGIHQVTLALAPAHWDPMIEFLTTEMNMRVAAEEGNRLRLQVAMGGPGQFLELRRDAHTSPGRNGIGTVHHVAWRVADDAALLALRERLLSLDLHPTEYRDRNYFHSVYFKPVAGMWFELATLGPGFDLDEPVAHLGEKLMLPSWEEPNRAAIEAALPPIP